MRATIEFPMPAQNAASGAHRLLPEDCSSARSRSSRSLACASMKAQMFMMKAEETQHDAEMKARTAALEEKRNLERERKMIESKIQ